MASFAKYSGPWTKSEAAHLIRRATYGLSPAQMNQAVSLGLDGTIEKLFAPQTLPSPPVNVSIVDDPDVPIGQTWHDKVLTGVTGRFNGSLRAWSMERFLGDNMNITEKMTVFWHNHFVTADINDPRLTYQYITLLRANALGSFKQLTKDITIDAAMLNYLNGRDNTKQAPNENFARELLELFTIGKGELVAPGDYTTYTETDIKEAAKVLTGWIDVRNQVPIRSEFRLNRHDITAKKLSARFNNVTIPNGNENEYKTLIDIIFERPEVATHICKKLYIWFVNPNITAEIEQDIIEPMANLLRNDNYNVINALKALLKSEHFYDECVHGTIIKNPIDFIVNIFNHFNIPIESTNLASKETAVNRILYNTCVSLQMAMYQAPSVSGWTPFYQAPAYDQIWLSSSTIPGRRSFSDGISGNGILNSGIRLTINHIKYLDSLSQPNDANAVVDEVVSYLLPKPIAQNQKDTIMAIFLNGFTNTAWANAYAAYLADPSSDAKKLVLTQRMTNLVRYLMRMPEFQLS